MCVAEPQVLGYKVGGRPLTGREVMRVHGFSDIKQGMDDKTLRHLAGDTISIPCIGLILALALANTEPGCGGAECNVGATSVGRGRRFREDNGADNLWKLADTRKVKRRWRPDSATTIAAEIELGSDKE